MKRNYHRRDEYTLSAGRGCGCVEFARDGPEGRNFKRTFIPVNSFDVFQPFDHGSIQSITFLRGLIHILCNFNGIKKNNVFININTKRLVTVLISDRICYIYVIGYWKIIMKLNK